MNKTKKAINKAFFEVLETKPLNKITISDIVKKCNVSRNTFYYHFKDIHDLEKYSVNEWYNVMMEKRGDLSSPVESVMPIIREMILHQNAYRNIYESNHRSSFILNLKQVCEHMFIAYIDALVSDGIVSAENRDNFIRFSKCALTGVIADWFDEGMSYDLIEFCNAICSAILAATNNVSLNK